MPYDKSPYLMKLRSREIFFVPKKDKAIRVIAARGNAKFPPIKIAKIRTRKTHKMEEILIFTSFGNQHSLETERSTPTGKQIKILKYIEETNIVMKSRRSDTEKQINLENLFTKNKMQGRSK